MKIDFNDSVLYITARSPFARRVRLAFLEHGIRFREEVLDLLKNPHLEYLAVNPLKRVPAVRLSSGEIIIDSNQILGAFYSSMDSPLKPASVAEAISTYRFSGIAIGLNEKLVEYFFEMLRPEETRDSELLEEIALSVKLVLADLALHLGSRETLASKLSQADLDVGSMLDYLCLRYSRDWMKEHRELAAYLERLRARPSFRATQPPPPA